MTIENIMNKCGQSLIKPSVVSAPMDFLTTEAEYIRVWQVRIARAENCRLYGQYGRACASWVQVYSKRHILKLEKKCSRQTQRATCKIRDSAWGVWDSFQRV